MSVKYNSVGRLRRPGMGFSVVRWLCDAGAWLSLNTKTGDAIAGFMLLEVAAPVWAPARIRTCASQGR